MTANATQSRATVIILTQPHVYVTVKIFQHTRARYIDLFLLCEFIKKYTALLCR